jgi:hypothetical protein
MPLRPDQLQLLEQWLQRKNVNPRCPSCGTSQWSVGELVAGLNVDPTGGGVSVGGNIVPLIQLICNNCAYVRSYAAVPIGLMKNEPAPTAK